MFRGLCPFTVYWVAVKELRLSYHNGYIKYTKGFPQYGNLI